MKKIVLSFLAVAIMVSGFGIAEKVSAAPASVSELVELLISIGVIGKDKAAAARTAGKGLDQVKAAAATSTAYIQVLEPSGTENWEYDLDLEYGISWGSSGVVSGNVALVLTKNVLCNLLPSPVNFSDGEDEIDVRLKTLKCYDNFGTISTTTLASGSYKVRVYGKDESGFEVKDESGGSIKVVPVPVPELKLTYPNGGEKLLRSESFTVKYSIKNIEKFEDGNISVQVYNNEGREVYGASKKLSENGQYEKFKFPKSLPAGSYKIKVSAETDSGEILEDTSDNLFWVSTAK
jgi:hypothetical protein